ncbi:MAG TPA: FAD-binding dehydrogenase, partial [Chloroflexota bacterium]|nr:FAD-binding dehydrogenase [Chloroflexota bacterium]
LAHTLAYHTRGAKPRLEYRPVRITQWQPQARSY